MFDPHFITVKTNKFYDQFFSCWKPDAVVCMVNLIKLYIKCFYNASELVSDSRGRKKTIGRFLFKPPPFSKDMAFLKCYLLLRYELCCSNFCLWMNNYLPLLCILCSCLPLTWCQLTIPPSTRPGSYSVPPKQRVFLWSNVLHSTTLISSVRLSFSAALVLAPETHTASKVWLSVVCIVPLIAYD